MRGAAHSQNNATFFKNVKHIYTIPTFLRDKICHVTKASNSRGIVYTRHLSHIDATNGIRLDRN